MVIRHLVHLQMDRWCVKDSDEIFFVIVHQLLIFFILQVRLIPFFGQNQWCDDFLNSTNRFVTMAKTKSVPFERKRKTLFSKVTIFF